MRKKIINKRILNSDLTNEESVVLEDRAGETSRPGIQYEIKHRDTIIRKD